MLISPSILATLRARVTSVGNGGLGTHTATYTALKNWCDSAWGNTDLENSLFGPSDRYYDAGMLRYALIYVLGEIPGFSYTTRSINDYGNKARDIMLRYVVLPGSMHLIEFVSYTYDWVSMASPKDSTYRMSDPQKQAVVSFLFHWAGATPQPPMYTGYFGLWVPNSFYPGLAFYGDGVGGSYGGYTADQLAQRYVDYIPTYLSLATPMTQQSGTGGGNRNGPCYTNYVWNCQYNIGSTLRSFYALTTATNLTANDTYNYYTSFMQTPIWLIYESQPGVGHWTHWGTPSSEVPLVLWDDCGLLTPNLTQDPITIMAFKLSAMLYGMIGNTNYQQLIYWFLKTKLNTPSNDTTLDILFNPRNISSTLPSSVSPVKAFGWDNSSGTIDHYLTSGKGGIGEVHMRSSLDFGTNPTVAIFRASPQFYSGDHNHFDSLSFYIFKGESLALPNTGKYFGLYEGEGSYPNMGFPHKWLYYSRNVAKNSILIMDPTDVMAVYFGSYTWTYRDGGQKVAGGDWGGLIKHEDRPDYTYSSADATVAYSNKADLVQRDFVYLKGTSSIIGDKDYFVVFDRVTSKVALHKKVFLLHSIGEPSLDVTGSWTFGDSNGGLYTANNVTSVTIPMRTAKLYMKSLLPSTNITYKYGGKQTTTTTQSIDNTDTGVPIEITVTSSDKFSPNPTVTIDYEAFSCSGKTTGKLIGCMRGSHYWRHNNPVSHSNGATVTQEFPWMFREVDTDKWVNYPHDFGGAHDPDYGYSLDEFGRWGIRIENGTDDLATNFLNVFHPTVNLGESNPTITLITSSSSNMQGALIDDSVSPRIVMFSPTTALVSDVTYAASYTQSLTGKHLITGLVPLAGYDIYKNGSKIGSKTGSSQGIIYFESMGGATFRLVRTSDPNPDRTPPTIPTNLTAAVMSSSQINLSWTASTDNVGIVGYLIYRNGNQIATSPINCYSDPRLSPATTYSYTVAGYDAAGNISGQSTEVSATTQSSADTIPPVRSSGSPTGSLPAGTKQVTLSLSTNENATCKYSTAAGASYSSIANTFSTTNGTAHLTTLSTLSGGTSYNYYIKCMDGFGNLNNDDYTISFTIASPPVTGGYVINDFSFHPAPNIPRPAKGVTFQDSAFHTNITRITDAPTDVPGSKYNYAQPGYPKHDIENANGTKLLIQSFSGSCYQIWNASFPYNKIKDVPSSIIGWCSGVDIRWDATDPNVMYISSSTNQKVEYHSKFLKYDVVTDVVTTLHDFADEFPARKGEIYPLCHPTMQEEGDSSSDSRYWAFIIICYDPQRTPNYYAPAVVRYDKDFYGRDKGKITAIKTPNDPLWATACLGKFPLEKCVNSMSTSPSGNYVMIDADGPEYILPPSLDLSQIRPLDCAAHADFALDDEGKEVTVCAGSYYRQGVNMGLWAKMVDLATGTVYWLAPLGANAGGKYHISGNSVSKPGWATFSVWGPEFNDVPNYPTDWSGHSVFMIELTRRIVDPTMDSHARVWMLAQTHTVKKDYGDDPFAKISKKGTKVWFGSGWDKSYLDPGGQYDVYQIDLPATWYQDLTGFNILNSSLAVGTINIGYSQNLSVSGGTIPYIWSIIGGALPSGLSLNSSTGMITGIPIVAGTSNFTVQVRDSSSPAKTANKTLSITINPVLDTNPPAQPTGLKIVK